MRNFLNFVFESVNLHFLFEYLRIFYHNTRGASSAHLVGSVGCG